MGVFGGFEWIIVVILLLLFGAKRIPQIARGIGQAIKELRTARESSDEDQFRTGE